MPLEPIAFTPPTAGQSEMLVLADNEAVTNATAC
jgi:hypothetical protein